MILVCIAKKKSVVWGQQFLLCYTKYFMQVHKKILMRYSELIGNKLRLVAEKVKCIFSILFSGLS